jgi:hypothetical protein
MSNGCPSTDVYTLLSVHFHLRTRRRTWARPEPGLYRAPVQQARSTYRPPARQAGSIL